jgi:hypothetical protein
MVRCGLILLLLFPSLVLAQDFKNYRTTTLDAVISEWDGRTKREEPGISFSRPGKLKFVATMRGAPTRCSNGLLATVWRMMGFEHLLKQMSVTHCLALASASGRPVVAFVQDVLVPGLNADAKVGGSLEIYADFLAYQVKDDRATNAPIMLVNRFEPR